jgi:UDP-glucose:(heptosyl)LPS alpha-1,3-glucosyltransferase
MCWKLFTNAEQSESNLSMKIALIRRRFSMTGGAELYAQRLLMALVRAGHEIHLLAEHWDAPLDGVEWHALPVSGNRASRLLRFADAAAAEVSRQSFDCVLSLERTRRQDVYRAGDGVHQVWLERRRQFASWWRALLVGRGSFHRNILALERLAFDPAITRHVIVNSNMVKREILERFAFPEHRLHLVRNGIEVERFRRGDRAATRARFGLDPSQGLLLFVGSGWERKGLKYLLAAVAQLPPDRTKLLVLSKDRMPARLPRNVIFAGVTERIEDAYAAADLFVFPPLYEPSANVCLEAWAAGLPVITSRYNGAAELIQEGVNGTVILNPTDPAALLEAIRFWMAQPDRRPVPVPADLSLERNVTETLAVLEMAARERRS